MSPKAGLGPPMVGSQCVLTLEGCQEMGSFKVALPQRTWGHGPSCGPLPICPWPQMSLHLPLTCWHPGSTGSRRGREGDSPRGRGSARGPHVPATSQDKMQAWPSSPVSAHVPQLPLQGLQRSAQRTQVCPRGGSDPAHRTVLETEPVPVTPLHRHGL